MFVNVPSQLSATEKCSLRIKYFRVVYKVYILSNWTDFFNIFVKKITIQGCLKITTLANHITLETAQPLLKNKRAVVQLLVWFPDVLHCPKAIFFWAHLLS